MSMTPDEFAGHTNVSRETLVCLEKYVQLLKNWNGRMNLVAESSLEDVWCRHVLDCFQLVSFIPTHSRHLLDMGAGAGLPGLILAIAMRDRADHRVILAESNAKKGAFLAQAAGELGLNVSIRIERLERLSLGFRPDVITARGLAPLDDLLSHAYRFAHEGSLLVFPKGQNVEIELTKVAKCWKMELRQEASQSSPHGTILLIRKIHRAEHQPG